MLLARFHFVQGSELPIRLQVGALQCHLSQDVNSGMLNILEFDFFDDEQLVVIYQSQSADCKHCGVRCLCCQSSTPTASAFITTISYVDVGYQELEVAKYVNGFREDLMSSTWDLWRKGEVCPNRFTAEVTLTPRIEAELLFVSNRKATNHPTRERPKFLGGSQWQDWTENSLCA